MEDKYKPLTESTYYVMIAFLYEKHGYAIKMFLEDKTHGRISLGPGTLYGI
ncbi:MAG TPA: PadR family transcriptional regulator, partial [Clostridium sp.]|nr:PadR family transcriptional regulator [Clostridium sp.]